MTTAFGSNMADDQEAAPEAPQEVQDTPAADAGEQEAPAAAEGGGETEETAAPTEEQPAAADTTDAAPAEGEEKPAAAEGETAAEGGEESAAAPAEGDPADAPAEGEGTDAAPPAEGEEAAAAAPAEGEEAVPAEGEAAAEGEQPAPAEGEAEGVEREAPAGEEGEKAEGADAAAEGEEKPEGEAAAVAAEGEGEQPAEGEGEAEGEEKKEEGEEATAAEKKDIDAIPEEGEEEEGEGREKSPIPQSDTFAEGEREETVAEAAAVGEALSPEASPRASPQPLEPGTPERRESPLQEEDEEEYYEEEDEEPMISREELIERYHAAMSEREQLTNQNFQLQHKLAEYFRKKKTDDNRQEMDKNVTDQEQRYLKYMSNLEELRHEDSDQREEFQLQIEDLKDKRSEKQEMVAEEHKQFTEFKRQSALSALNSRSGKPILERDVEQYLSNESKKEVEVVQVRLENIKLKNRLKKREQQLKAKEELAEGLHLIDFEQLKIENQTYNEKIEERNEELLKLRKKITSTVQVLTHLKEKLQFVQAENQVQKLRLKDVEALVAQKRDILSRTKKARDMLRIDNHRLRQKSGLLGNEPLLRDFEERKDEGEDLRQKLETLRRQHAELVLNTNGFRKKIEQAKAARA